MDELRNLVAEYDPYYEMADDSATWRSGREIDNRIREVVKLLRAQDHGPEIDALMEEHPYLCSCPGGAHALV